MTRTPEAALNWMKNKDASNETGWQGWCLKSCRTAYDLPGGWSEADEWWADCPDQYKHPWSDKPPLGMPVYWRIGEHGHVALSDGTGQIYGTDLPTNDQIGRASIHAPRTKWGATPEGWANWLNGQVLPYTGDPGTDVPGQPSQGDEGMDYAEVTRNSPQGIEGNWERIVFDKENRDSANLHYKDGIFSLAGRRFEFDLSLTVDVPVAARISLRAVVLKSENNAVVQTYPVSSFKVGPGNVSSISTSLSGYCAKDNRVVLEARAYDSNMKITPFTTVRSWV